MTFVVRIKGEGGGGPEKLRDRETGQAERERDTEREALWPY